MKPFIFVSLKKGITYKSTFDKKNPTKDIEEKMSKFGFHVVSVKEDSEEIEVKLKRN